METLFTTLAIFSYWALSVYEWIIIIAILITWVSPDPRNPVVAFLWRMTRPLWDYLAVRLPPALRLFSAYVSLLLVWFLKIFLPGSLRALAGFAAGEVSMGELPARVVGFFLLGGGIVVQNLLFFLIVLQLVWFFFTLISPSANNPIVRALYQLVDPFITPFQRRLPRMKVDISPLLAAGVFLLINVMVVAQLIGFAAGLAHYSGNFPPPRVRAAALHGNPPVSGPPSSPLAAPPPQHGGRAGISPGHLPSGPIPVGPLGNYTAAGFFPTVDAPHPRG